MTDDGLLSVMILYWDIFKKAIVVSNNLNTFALEILNKRCGEGKLPVLIITEYLFFKRNRYSVFLTHDG